MLSKQTFAKGLAIINANLGRSNKVTDESDWDIIYFQLKDLPEELFLIGVSELIKNEDTFVFPGIHKIRRYVELQESMGYNKSELYDLACVRKSSGIPYSNKKLDNIIKTIDVEKSTENNLIFNKGDYYIE